MECSNNLFQLFSNTCKIIKCEKCAIIELIEDIRESGYDVDCKELLAWYPDLVMKYLESKTLLTDEEKEERFSKSKKIEQPEEIKE